MSDNMIKGETTGLAGGERELLESCWRQEAGAWERFLTQYSKLIYYSIHRTCSLRHYYPAPDEIEDLFSELLVNLIKNDFRKLRQYRGYEGASVATWLRTITVRHVIDYLRQRARAPEFLEIEAEEISYLASLADPVTRPDEELEAREELRLFMGAVGRLGENDRYFMELYYLKGLSPEAVAQVLGLSVKTVYSRINRLKAKLQKEIDDLARK